jgi:murein tripeptide amidase MpaA
LLDPLVSNMRYSLTNLQFFSHSLVGGDFAQSLCSSPMKRLKVRQHSFQKLTQFTMFGKVQDTLACKVNPSLTSATVLLPFTLMG